MVTENALLETVCMVSSIKDNIRNRVKTDFSGKNAYEHLRVIADEIGPRHGGSLPAINERVL